MRKWRKALTCGLLGTLAVCLSTVAFAMQPQPVQALQQGVQTTISGESSYWQETKGFFHMPSNSLSYVNTAQMVDVTGDGYGDGYMSTATSQKLDGNTQIDISMKGYFTGDAGTGYWGYNWIIFQNTTEMYTGTASSIRTASNWTPFRLRVDESPSNSVGNWFALVFGKTENAVNLYECNSGEVKKIHTLYQSSGEEDAVKAHSIHAKTTDISIKTSDSATGVTVDITYTVGGNTYTYKHSSDNNALLGEQTLTLGYHGGVQCTTENGAYTQGTFSYDVKVTTSQSAMTYESYNGLQGYTQATGEGEWVSTTNLSTNATGDLITVSAPSRPTGTSDVFSSYAETKQVGGNSTLDLTINGTIQRDPNWAESVGLWAYDW
ncbi:MAG: hypothetical protein E7368_04640, partial [Clostridiales bacterium]|nr:hypothetical protein [Clostridiales bacterium]